MSWQREEENVCLHACEQTVITVAFFFCSVNSEFIFKFWFPLSPAHSRSCSCCCVTSHRKIIYDCCHSVMKMERNSRQDYRDSFWQTQLISITKPSNIENGNLIQPEKLLYDVWNGDVSCDDMESRVEWLHTHRLTAFFPRIKNFWFHFSLLNAPLIFSSKCLIEKRNNAAWWDWITALWVKGERRLK